MKDVLSATDLDIYLDKKVIRVLKCFKVDENALITSLTVCVCPITLGQNNDTNKINAFVCYGPECRQKEKFYKSYKV